MNPSLNKVQLELINAATEIDKRIAQHVELDKVTEDGVFKESLKLQIDALKAELKCANKCAKLLADLSQ